MTTGRSIAVRLASLILGAALMAGACAPADEQASVGASAPRIEGTTLDGAPFDLGSLAGRPVVVNFWASWCGPCRAEFPVLADQLAAHETQGMALVGVLFKDDPAPASDFVADFGATWPTVDDPDDAIATTYRVVAPPQTYFIDADGIVRGIHIGELKAADFETQWAKIAP